MPGYFDPNAEAQMLGHALGRLEGERHGERVGFRDGQQDGYAVGYSDGKADGWNAAIEVANREMIKQKEITTKHANEKQRLEIEVQALRELIKQCLTKLDELDVQVEDRTSQYNEALWQLNRCAVFMNSTRAVLEDLIAVDSPQVDHVRELFAKRYMEHVEAALKKGSILTPLDADEVLTKSMPRTQRFIRYILASAQ